MSIKLSNEVKNIIATMLKTSKDFKLGGLNTLALLDALLTNQQFSSTLEVTSICTKNEIIETMEELLDSADFADEDESEEGEKELSQEILKEAKAAKSALSSLSAEEKNQLIALILGAKKDE